MEARMVSEHSTRKHNFPAQVSSFIGREQELRELEQRLREHRLMTLTGTGGTGKTRLAIQAAMAERDHFSDGAWLVDLAPLTPSELVLETIAKVFTVPEAPGPSQREQLGAYLETKHLLLVLDNCEHVIDECSHIVAFLVARCPYLTLLVTSREPLLIDGEVILRIAALSLPDPSQPLDLVNFLRYDAPRLFVERAQAADSSFRLTDGNAEAVAEICRHLDGLPLALELAAVRVRGMGVVELLKRLDQRFHLLTRRKSTALPRQQTLHAMIDWSYRLLSEPEQIVLRRLGVFVGAFTLDAAESVCAGAYLSQNGQECMLSEMILHHLLQLVNKSLVQFNQEASQYRLLETIRLFSLEQLAEASELQDICCHHFAYYLQGAEHAAPDLSGPLQEVWFTQLEAEHDNVRSALTWALETGRVEEAARLALAVWHFWHTHTYQREGLRWLEHILVLDAVTPLQPAVRPQLLNALGVLSHSQFQFDRALSYHTEALRLFREEGDLLSIALALCDIGRQRFEEMKLEQAREYARESLELARAVGNQRAAAKALFLDAIAATEGEQVEEAVPSLEESLVLFREMGDMSNMAMVMSTLARAESKRGNHERAKPLLRDAVRLQVQLGTFIDFIGPLVALKGMAMQTPAQPEGARRAAQVVGMMAAWMEKLTPVGEKSPWERGPFQQDIEQVRAMLGTDAFTQAFGSGKRMTSADLVQIAEHITALPSPVIQLVAPHPAFTHDHLSVREVEVLRFVSTGLTNDQVAHRLSIASRTVNAHLTAIYRKLGVTSRNGAIRYALEHQLG